MELEEITKFKVVSLSNIYLFVFRSSSGAEFNIQIGVIIFFYYYMYWFPWIPLKTSNVS